MKPVDQGLEICRSCESAVVPSDGGHWRDMIPAVLLLIVGLAGLACATLWPSGAGNQYLVVASPWSDVGETVDLVRTADGGVVAFSRFSNVVVARSASPDFAKALRKAGAWGIFEPLRPAGCVGTQGEGAIG